MSNIQEYIQLNNLLDNIKDKINLLTNKIDENIILTQDYVQFNKTIENLTNPILIDLKEKTQSYIEKFDIIIDETINIVSNITELLEENDIEDENDIVLYNNNESVDQPKNRLNSHPYCDYEGHCDYCSKPGKDDYDYCKNKCQRCLVLRGEENKTIKKNAQRYYNECMPKKDKYVPLIGSNIEYISDKNSKLITNITNITNNTIININNLALNVKEYIETKDFMFCVSITSSHEKAEEKLRYIFTYLMCGASGRKIFSNELKYSKATSFPVIAARYKLTNKNNNYTLFGLLRYQYQNVNRMTIKKLENMGDQYATVKAILPELWENTKHHLSIHDVDDMILNTIEDSVGSNPEDFYLEN